MEQTSSPLSYLALARKYRPKKFADLVGQKALVQTFVNALRSERLHHAYLLTGIRGTGKTSTARLLACAINCPEKPEGDIEPCGKCSTCLEIERGSHMDVQEIDAASFTGVEHIRQLLENVPYAPTSARYKVYIIDEVHMLSTSAFNALLKTLEEPPAHVKFFFATTEVEKIPLTVLSRCQRIDLRRVKEVDLIDHLKTICEKEKISFSPQALHLIAFEADGSVRDALSLLDQAWSQSDGNITKEVIQSMLGLANQQECFELLHFIVERDVEQTIQKARDMYQKGMTAPSILRELLSLVHLITQKRLLPTLSAETILPEEAKKHLEKLSQELSMPVLNLIWQVLFKGLEEVQRAPHPFPALEMVLFRLLFALLAPSPEKVLQTVKEKKKTP